MHGYVIAGAALALVTAVLLGWKWQLGVLRAGVVVLAVSMLVAAGLAGLGPVLRLAGAGGAVVVWGATVLVGAAVLAVLFFRDPDRVPPGRRDVVVSPADGRVIYVRPARPGQVPVADKRGRACPLRELAGTALGGGAVAVGISMSLSDVHVNRAPVAGRVRFVRRTPGAFGSLRDPQMAARNERVTTVIEAGDLQVAVVQIASRLVRRIVSFAGPGDVVGLGQRVGAIRFGSQVDLLVPARADVVVAVQPGDRVVAGQTIMAVVTSRAGAVPGPLRDAGGGCGEPPPGERCVPAIPHGPGTVRGGTVRGAGEAARRA
ncbi:MAG TPA: phosphatidylserine decarboxylase [Streptosporangiaceae bacterium]|nr:phosphatidylserine decarboxylase [Streptosporangiaceae bacterium]